MAHEVGTSQRPLRVAIIGTGPGGFYAAVALLAQQDVHVEVDLFDRLPTPYGLVRGGVAPDHQKIKSVTRVYEKAAQKPNCRFFGNVQLGRDVRVEDLLRLYDQLVYAVGNESERRLGVPGESLAGCIPAGSFVGWYNAHPDYSDLRFPLDCSRVAVVGNGNVAIDVARILAKQPEDLRSSDIPDYALEALADSRVQEIVLLGRRGPVQAAFTPLELKELTELNQAGIVVDPAEVDLDEPSRVDLEASKASAACRRNVAILSAAPSEPDPGWRRWIRFCFLVSPVELLGDAQGRVRAVRLERNRLHRSDDGSLRPRGTGETEDLEVGCVFPSIGYRGRPVPDAPFDDRRGIIPNVEGRVVDSGTATPLPAQYVVGWANSGPRGLIGMHKSASGEVVRRMLDDVAAGVIDAGEPVTRDAIVRLLTERGVRYVTFDDWKRIDRAETERGRDRGAPRRKFSRIDELVEAAHRKDA